MARSQDDSDPLADLALFAEKELVMVGGFGTSSAPQSQQWRSMWDAFKQYGDGGDPPKEVCDTPLRAHRRRRRA
jgi:hypothetical protein